MIGLVAEFSGAKLWNNDVTAISVLDLCLSALYTSIKLKTKYGDHEKINTESKAHMMKITFIIIGGCIRFVSWVPVSHDK